MSQRRRAIALIVAPLALLVSLLTWGVSSPQGSSPDEHYHLASIWCADGIVPGVCEEGSAPQYRSVRADIAEASHCFRWHPDQSAACVVDDARMVETDQANWAGEAYPPVFYSVMRMFIVPDDVGLSVLILRSLNAVLYVGLLTALFFLLPRRLRPPMIWGAALTIVPLGAFLIPSINPSTWAILSATGLWVATWGYFVERRLTRRILLGALAVTFLVVGAGARSDAAVYGVLAMIVGTVLGFERSRRFLLSAILPVALTAVAVAFFFTSGQSAIVSASTASTDAPLALHQLAFLDLKLLPELWAGVFGTWGLGWLDTTMPGSVWVTTIAMFSAVCFWALSRGDVRKWIVTAGVAASLVVVPMFILLHDGVIVGQYVQPRYIYPLIILFAGVVVTGFRRPGLGLNRTQLLVVAAGLTVANSVALHVNLRRYVTGVDVPGLNLDLAVEWWWNAPITPLGVWALGTVATAVLAGILVRAAWSGREDAKAIQASSVVPRA